jgi:ribose transport system permease protein
MNSIKKKADMLNVQDVLNRKAKYKFLLSESMPVLGLLVLTVLFNLLTGGLFLSSSNLVNMVSQGFTMILIATGAAFVYALGNIDMSVGSVMAIAQLITAMLCQYFNINGWMALFICICISIACTSMSAVICSVLHVPSFVASLCMMSILNGIISWVIENGDIFIDYSLYKGWDTTIAKIITLVIVAISYTIIFNKTKIGKSAKAIGGNNLASIVSGIRVPLITWICYALMGISIGLAGYYGLIRSSRASVASSSIALNVIIAIVLGGFPMKGGSKAKIHSAIIGSITVTFLDNGLTLYGQTPELTLLIKGILFLIVVGLTTDRSKGKLVK